MKTAFLINGFSMNTTAAHDNFAELRDMLSTKGYRVEPVEIVWNYTTMSEFVDKFIKLYRHQKNTHNTIIGNSFGAMAAFIAAPKIVPDEIVLCSLSPFFSEDLPQYTEKRLINFFGKRRLADFQTISANEIAKQINAKNIKATLLYGEKEQTRYPNLVTRVKNTASMLKNSRPIEIPKAGHKMHQPAYIKGLQKAIQ